MSIRRVIAAAAGVALAVGLSVGLAATAHASDPAVPSATWNEITVPFDGMAGNRLCMDIPHGSSSPGLALQLFGCHGGTNQQWHFQTVTNGGHLLAIISNPTNGLCIDATGRFFPTQVVQQLCSASTPKWLILPQNDNGTNPLLQLELVSANGTGLGVCMAAGNMSDQDSTPLVLHACQPLQPTPGDLSQVLELA
jgi:hypothetical protein